MTDIRSFNTARHGTRISVLAHGGSAMLGLHALGVDVSVYLDLEDLRSLSENIQKVLLRASVNQLEVV